MFDLITGKAGHIPSKPGVPLLFSIASQLSLVMAIILPVLFFAGTLRFLGAADRRLGFGASRFERRLLLLGCTALHRNHRGLAVQARHVVFGTRELRLVADDADSESMLLVAESGDGSHGLGDRIVETRKAFARSGESEAVGGNPLAQLLDLATGGENAARLRLGAARYQMRPAQDVTFDRGNDRRGLARVPRAAHEG